MEFRLGWRSRFERRGRRGPFVLMTQRRRLDQYLAEQAAAAGADFRDGVKVAVEAGRRPAVAVPARGRRAPCRPRSSSARTGRTARPPARSGSAARSRTASPSRATRRSRSATGACAVIELGTIPGGYGWVFPKGDHVNVGVGGWECEGPRLREHLAELCRRHGDRRRRARERARPPAAAAAGRLRPARRAGAPRRRRGRARRPADRRRHVRGVRQRAARGRGGARRARRPGGDRRALRRAARPRRSDRWRGARGGRRSRSTASRGRRSRSPGRRSSGRVVERLVRGDISAPAEARGLARPPLKAIAALARIAGAAAAV